jgi:type III pantothenate kinase
MNLVIDWGNTAAKAALFDEGILKESFYQLSEDELLQIIQSTDPQHIILSSVRKDLEAIGQKIQEKYPLIILDSQTPAPFQNLYGTPQTLGVDRIAGVIGAKVLYPNRPCLVIDLGTCITFDFIDAENNYLGGNIAPGLQMRLKAMHHFTAKLPLLDFDFQELTVLTGQSTRQAMLSGAVEGICFEIEGYQRVYAEKYPELITIVCGGDAIFFESKLKPLIFAVRNLTLIGLNRILQYNVENN